MTANFYMRTLTLSDASERFAAWFDQVDVREALNLPARAMSKAEIAAYISRFDQRTNFLVGIFDKTNDLLVAIITIQIDWKSSRFLANTVVGEADYRHRGVLLEIARPWRDYFFETLDLQFMAATALASNGPIIRYLAKTGWTLVRTLKNHTRRNSDGAMIDLCLYQLTRDDWRAWKAANPPASV
ncbi:MAG: GNAT family N-acetyltransferase [Alphaproteobacteria bacterium]|nr:GNAT family N-acetyltransferase [Alphaproteobacteria bacterium]